MDEELLGQLTLNEVVTVTELSGDWGRFVRSDGTSGWTKVAAYATYIGQDLLASDIIASREHVRITTDAKRRVVLTNDGAAPVTVDLPVRTPIGTLTTPYFNLSATPLYGQYAFGFVDDESGYTMRYDPAADKLVTADTTASLSQYRAVQLCVRNWWTPIEKHQIDYMRIYLDAQSSVRFNIVYFSDEPDVVKTVAYNTRPYDGSDTAVVLPANVNLMEPTSLAAVDPTAYGGYRYEDGVLTVQSEQEEGYAVTMQPQVRYTPEALHRWLYTLSADVDYDLEMTVTTADGDLTISLASDYAAALGTQGEWVPAGEYNGSLDLYDLCKTYQAMEADGQSTIQSVTVKTRGVGTVTVSCLQINNNDAAVVFTDGIVKSEQTPSPVPEEMAGDLNGDGMMDMLDVFAMFSAASEGRVDEGMVQKADTNGDGIMDMLDVLAWYRIADGG